MVHRLTRDTHTFDLEADKIGESFKSFSVEGFKANDSAISPDGQHVIAVGDGVTIVWNIASGQVIHQHKSRYGVQQDYIRRLGDSDFYATIQGQLRNKLVIWNPITGQVREKREIPRTRKLVLSPDGKWALSSDFATDLRVTGHNVRLWRVVHAQND